jgi:hypothetical protein
MSREVLIFPVSRDARGDTLSVEFNEVPFPVFRIFFITNSPNGIVRGGHIAGCRELAVLVSGGATFMFGDITDGSSTFELVTPGDAVLIEPGDYVRYYLKDTNSKIAVLADKPYSETLERK